MVPGNARCSLPPNAAAQPYSQVNGIACVSAGNCVAVGDYEYGKSNSLQAFIATEYRGKWARAFAPRLPPATPPLPRRPSLRR